jgi:hypothetical protein
MTLVSPWQEGPAEMRRRWRDPLRDRLPPRALLLTQRSAILPAMTGTALAERLTTTARDVVDPAAIDRRTKNARPKRVPKGIKAAVRLILTGEVTTIKAAAERVNLSRDWLSRCLAMPHALAFIAQERAKIIAEGSLRAAARFTDLVDATSEHLAAKVSERLLEEVGALRPQSGGGVNVNIQNNVTPGYVVRLRAGDDEEGEQGPLLGSRANI